MSEEKYVLAREMEESKTNIEIKFRASAVRCFLFPFFGGSVFGKFKLIA